MDAKTLEALRGSIAKWKAIEEGKIGDGASDNCPLCQLFPDCDGYPVMKRTGKEECEDSPYYAFRDWDIGRRIRTHRPAMLRAPVPINPARHKKGVRLARAEREFLESLLPEGEQP